MNEIDQSTRKETPSSQKSDIDIVIDEGKKESVNADVDHAPDAGGRNRERDSLRRGKVSFGFF